MMNFGQALELLKQGKRVARTGWNGKGMFVYLTKTNIQPVSNMESCTANVLFGERLLECDEVVEFNEHIDMRTVDGRVQIGWLASQSDMLSEDWIEV